MFCWLFEEAMCLTLSFKQSSRRNHPQQYQAIYARPLGVVEKHASPFALTVICNEMKRSLAYSVEVIPLPANLCTWVRLLSIYHRRLQAPDLQRYHA